jgi:hypothetical protein
MKIYQRFFSVLFLMVLFISCSKTSFKGKWQYNGGIYDGTARPASADFKMQRSYTSDKYEAYMIDGENPPEKYGSGSYQVKNDTFYVTSEFSAQPSQLLGKTIAYTYKFETDTLTIKGTLPNGMKVEEYWQKVK